MLRIISYDNGRQLAVASARLPDGSPDWQFFPLPAQIVGNLDVEMLTVPEQTAYRALATGKIAELRTELDRALNAALAIVT